MSDRRSRKTAQKVLLSVTALAAAAALAGAGTYANFTASSIAQPQDITTGTMTLTLGATGASTNRLNIPATAVAPTDTIQRTVDLAVSGTVGMSAITLTTTDTVGAPTALSTDATNGLQVLIERCSVPWTEGGTAPAYTYVCSGTTTAVLASSRVTGLNRALGSMLVAAGDVNHLRVTMTLPTTAGDSFQNLSATISYVFAGVQRAGISR